MDSTQIETVLGILGGMGLIYLASSQDKSGSMAEVKDKPKTKTNKRTKPKETYQQYLDRIRGTDASNQQQNEPNPQRYNVFLDIIERYTNPAEAGWRDMMIMMPAPGDNLATGNIRGTHAGSVRSHNQICQINENDGKWGAMSLAGTMALQEAFTMNDITQLIINGQHTLNSFALVLVAIPTTAESLEDQLAGAKWKIFGEYATYGDAGRNYSSIFGPVVEACQNANAPFNNLLND